MFVRCAETKEMVRTNFTRDELQASELPPCLLVDDVLHLRIYLREWLIQALVLQAKSACCGAGRIAQNVQSSGQLTSF